MPRRGGSQARWPRLAAAARVRARNLPADMATVDPPGLELAAVRPAAATALRRASVACAGVLLIGLLTWPLLFTNSGFGGDWAHHLWLVWHQTRALEEAHAPSFFLSTSYSIFDPIFAFYGGTLYALTGLAALALGSVAHAYVLSYVLAFAAALAGWYWLARIAGVGRWAALAPGLVFVTCAHYLAVAYASGDWPEFVGVSMIPPMVAASVSILRAERLRAGPAAALAACSLVFFGAHNITLLLGATTLALNGLAIVAFVPRIRRGLRLRALARVAGVVVPAALVSAWYLLPALAYGERTRIGHESSHLLQSIRETAWLVSAAHLFSFSRAAGEPLPAPFIVTSALPVAAIAWVLAGAVVLFAFRRRGERVWDRLLLIFCALAVLIGIVMTHVDVLLALPRLYTVIQFSYRIDNYVVLELCAAMLAVLALPTRPGVRAVRVWRWLALPVCIVSLVGAVQQLTSYPYPGEDRNSIFTAYGQVYTGENEDYKDDSERVYSGGGPTLRFALGEVRGNTVSGSVRARPGSLVATNIAAGAYLVDVSGAKPVGIDYPEDDMMLRVGAGGSPGGRGASKRASTVAPRAYRVTITTGHSAAVMLGRVLSFVGLAALALELVALALARIRPWSRARASARRT